MVNHSLFIRDHSGASVGERGKAKSGEQQDEQPQARSGDRNLFISVSSFLCSVKKDDSL